MNPTVDLAWAQQPEGGPRLLPMLSDLWTQGAGFPIALRIAAGDALPRTGWPLGVALSLPPGVLAAQGETLEVRDGSQSLPSQVEAKTCWPDGTVQHLRLYFLGDLPSGPPKTVQITGVRPERPPGCRVTESETGAEVDTGAAVFWVDHRGTRQIIGAQRGGVSFLPPQGEAACWAGAFLDASTGNFRDPARGYGVTCRIVSGEVATRFFKELRTWQDGEEMRMFTELSFFTGAPWVRLYSWGERNDYQRHPLVEEEIAFHGSFLCDGPTQHREESRFGPASRSGILEVGQRGGYGIRVLLPWLRELGITSNTNLVLSGIPGGQQLCWRPVSSPRPGQSPMNSPCWVARYWREAGLLFQAPEGEEELAEAVCRELRLEGPMVSLPELYDPALLLEERLSLPAEACETVDALASGLMAARLSPDYPNDGIDGQEWHNWESAYFHGFGWRSLHAGQPKAFGPRAMKSDGLHLLDWRSARSGDPAVARVVALQARAWPVNLAPARMRWGFGFCDIGYYGKRQPRGCYPAEVAMVVPSASNAAYAGRLLFYLYVSACRTGETMLFAAFEQLYARLFEMFEDKSEVPFDGDRIWIILRDLVRLYQYTEAPRFLADLDRLLSRLPQRMSAAQWNDNYQCRLWNNESYALLYRLLGEERMRHFHEGQLEAYLADARVRAADTMLLLPMVATLPPEFRWGLLAAQLMTAFAASQAWEGADGEAHRWFCHYETVVRKHLLTTSPVWTGLHYALYPAAVYRSISWRERTGFAGTLSGRSAGWDTDIVESTQAPGELFRAWTLQAATFFPYRVDLSRREITFFITPSSLPRRAIAWPGGSLAVCVEGEGERIAIELQCDREGCALLFPAFWRIVVEEGCGRSEESGALTRLRVGRGERLLAYGTRRESGVAKAVHRDPQA